MLDFVEMRTNINNTFLAAIISPNDLSVRAYNCLKNAGINTLGDLMRGRKGAEMGRFVKIFIAGQPTLVRVRDGKNPPYP